MRYKLVLLPFMGRVHATLTWWDPSDPRAGTRVQTWDIGPEDTETEHLYALLSYIAGDMAADQN